MASRSGATNRSVSSPRRNSAVSVARSSADCELSICRALTPDARRLSTWSFISAISGDTTTVTPPWSSAGAW